MKNTVIKKLNAFKLIIVILVSVLSLSITYSYFAKADIIFANENTEDNIELDDNETNDENENNVNEIKTGDLIYIYDNKSFAATIKYEKDDVNLTFIMPDGTEIDANTDGVSKDNYSISKTETSTTIVVMNAQNGQWMLRYDKGSNESLSVSFTEIAKQSFYITSLKMNVNEYDKYNYYLEFITSTKEDENDTDYNWTYYDYEIYLKSKSGAYEPRLLKEGYAITEETVTVSVDLDYVNSASDYYFEVIVTCEINGFQFNDFVATEEFSFENTDYSLEVSQNYSFLLNLTSGIGNVTYDDYLRYGDVVYAKIYIDDELYEEFEFSNSLKTSQFLFTSDSKIVKLEVYREENGFRSDVYTEEVKISDESRFNIIWPENSLIYAHALGLSYKNANSTVIEVWGHDSSNTNKKISQTLNGDGQITVNLVGDEATVHASYKIENVTFEVYKSFTVDTITPNLTIYNKVDGVYTDKSYFIIEGYTNAPELYINDIKVDTNGGVFTYEIRLEKGSNKISIKAVKNEYLASEYVATVIRNTTSGSNEDVEKDNGFDMLIIGLLVSVVGIIGLVMFGFGKKRFTWKKLLDFTIILMWIASVYGWVMFIIRKIFEGSEEYIFLALESLKDAQKYLSTTTSIMIWSIVLTSVTFVVTVVTVVITCVMKAKKKKLAKQTNTQTNEQVNDSNE